MKRFHFSLLGVWDLEHTSNLTRVVIKTQLHSQASSPIYDSRIGLDLILVNAAVSSWPPLSNWKCVLGPCFLWKHPTPGRISVEQVSMGDDKSLRCKNSRQIFVIWNLVAWMSPRGVLMYGTISESLTHCPGGLLCLYPIATKNYRFASSKFLLLLEEWKIIQNSMLHTHYRPERGKILARRHATYSINHSTLAGFNFLMVLLNGPTDESVMYL